MLSRHTRLEIVEFIPLVSRVGMISSLFLLAGCVSISVSTSSGGGSGADATECISILNPHNGSGQAVVKNNCEVSVNFLEFSTGSQGLILIPPQSEIVQSGFVFAWGACVAPAIPRRIGDFDYYCQR